MRVLEKGWLLNIMKDVQIGHGNKIRCKDWNNYRAHGWAMAIIKMSGLGIWNNYRAYGWVYRETERDGHPIIISTGVILLPVTDFQSTYIQNSSPFLDI